MRRIASSQDLDLLLGGTCDRVNGKELYHGSDPKGGCASKIIRGQDIDMLCSGNHDLYRHESAEIKYNTAAPDFRDIPRQQFGILHAQKPEREHKYLATARSLQHQDRISKSSARASSSISQAEQRRS